MSHNFILGPCDTDSISFCKPDMSAFTEEEQDALLAEINLQMPELIQYAHDGYFHTIVIVAAKNYILYDGEEVKIKGSGLKASMKEPALKEFINRIINCFVFDKQNEVLDIYFEYVREIFNVKDIYRWSSKKTLTEAVLNAERTNEQKVWAAVEDQELQEGDKFFVYFKADGSLCIPEKWNNDHDPEVLLKKLYKTMEVFSSIYDMNNIPKFHLKAHKYKCALAEVLGLPVPEKVKKTRKKKETKLNSLSHDDDDPEEGHYDCNRDEGCSD